MTANRLLLTAIAALALAGAAHPQETDNHVASMGEQGFRRFASLCQDQKAACDAAFRFGALVGADAAMRCAFAGDRITCFKKTMNSQEFMEEERKAISGQRTPNNDGERALVTTQVGSSYARRRGAFARRTWLPG